MQMDNDLGPYYKILVIVWAQFQLVFKSKPTPSSKLLTNSFGIRTIKRKFIEIQYATLVHSNNRPRSCKTNHFIWS